MKCKKCGADLVDNAKFCVNCGTSVDNSKSVIFNTVAPAIMGTDNKNVNFVIASLLNPINLPANIVVPLLENPGKTANA